MRTVTVRGKKVDVPGEMGWYSGKRYYSIPIEEYALMLGRLREDELKNSLLDFYKNGLEEYLNAPKKDRKSGLATGCLRSRYFARRILRAVFSDEVDSL
jgi:hypothetical protein